MPARLKAEERQRRRQIGEAVRQAREANGWTLEDLGLHLQRTSTFQLCRQTLAKIESGNHRLPPELVKALESSLRRPAGLLAAQGANTGPKARLTGVTVDGACSPSQTVIVQQHLILAVQDRLRLAAHARRGMPRFRCPFKFQQGSLSQAEIEQQADLLRQRWNWGEGPVADVTYSLERQSVVITRLMQSESAAVVSGRVSSYPAIGWIGKLPENATEFADYRMKILSAFVRSVGFSRDGHRTISNHDVLKLSRAILIPAVAVTDSFGTRCNQITAPNLLTFAEIYAVPVATIVDRMLDLGLADSVYAQGLRRQLAGDQLCWSRERPRWKNLLPGS